MTLPEVPGLPGWVTVAEGAWTIVAPAAGTDAARSCLRRRLVASLIDDHLPHAGAKSVPPAAPAGEKGRDVELVVPGSWHVGGSAR